jgi:hypothetical protein
MRVGAHADHPHAPLLQSAVDEAIAKLKDLKIELDAKQKARGPLLRPEPAPSVRLAG